MDRDLEQRIRARAHELWEQSGRVDGQADEHWRQAERELTALSDAQQESTAPKSASKRRAAPKDEKSAAPAGEAPKRRRTAKQPKPA